MERRTRKVFAYLRFILFGLIASGLSGHASAYDRHSDHVPSASLMVLDAVVFRPTTLALTAVGGVAFILSLPFSATGGNVAQAKEKLVMEPWRFTFHRPLGEFP